ncbi:CBS domain-containing protein [Nonomuraea sp. NPDC049141]|uniref:CBS domain-containing protein n=1 Tax=unclassified Nonomuraea TaxID=2593643 RepID=UPI0033FCD501
MTMTVADVMTSAAHVTTPDSPIVLAARLMDRHGVKRLPVVDADGGLVGIVSRRDLSSASTPRPSPPSGWPRASTAWWPYVTS